MGDLFHNFENELILNELILLNLTAMVDKGEPSKTLYPQHSLLKDVKSINISISQLLINLTHLTNL